VGSWERISFSVLGASRKGKGGGGGGGFLALPPREWKPERTFADDNETVGNKKKKKKKNHRKSKRKIFRFPNHWETTGERRFFVCVTKRRGKAF